MSFSESNDLSVWLAKNLDNLTFSIAALGQERVRAGGACIGLTLQSHRAILLLVEAQLVGSAAALVRVMFESYVRGAWLLYCATDKQIEKYIKGKQINNHFSELVHALEALPVFRESGLSRTLGKPWATMNSYTHCGAHQITRGNTEAGIEPAYTDEECEEFVRFADGFALAAGAILAELAGKEELSLELLARAKGLPA